MDLQILISILWLSCSVQGQQEPDVIITSSEPSIGKVSNSFVVHTWSSLIASKEFLEFWGL